MLRGVLLLSHLAWTYQNQLSWYSTPKLRDHAESRTSCSLPAGCWRKKQRWDPSATRSILTPGTQVSIKETQENRQGRRPPHNLHLSREPWKGPQGLPMPWKWCNQVTTFLLWAAWFFWTGCFSFVKKLLFSGGEKEKSFPWILLTIQVYELMKGKVVGGIWTAARYGYEEWKSTKYSAENRKRLFQFKDSSAMS